MSRKKKLYSLLAILCSVTLLVTGVICVLILELAKQSTANFENFIIESRQQEISSAVHAFSSDVDTRSARTSSTTRISTSARC